MTWVLLSNHRVIAGCRDGNHISDSTSSTHSQEKTKKKPQKKHCLEKTFPENANKISGQSNTATVDIINQLWPGCWQNLRQDNKEAGAYTANCPGNVTPQFVAEQNMKFAPDIFNTVTLFEPGPHSLIKAFPCISAIFASFVSKWHLMPLKKGERSTQSKCLDTSWQQSTIHQALRLCSRLSIVFPTRTEEKQRLG